MTDPFESLVAARRRATSRGLYSVCSSHPLVLEAAVKRAALRGLPLLVEATANQVNQEGGYTGLKPADFAARLEALCNRYQVAEGLVTFGGDHLGPHPWRSLPAARAMAAAELLVRGFVAAGARKIHLDASMALGDDGGLPAPPVVASRAARLCAAAEDEFRRVSAASVAAGGAAPLPPVYVVGTEVPVPGGTVGAEAAPGDADRAGPRPTSLESLNSTLELHEAAFEDAGLLEAWKRVRAIVVQPGVEFESALVHPYCRERAAPLRSALAARPDLFFEGHSTDYQSDAALRELVEDGFAFLKVGPALTFALREALFGLAAIAAELGGRKTGAELPALLRQVMLDDDRYWRDYYPKGDETALLYSLSDRARYYWDRPLLAAAVERLFAALDGQGLPPGLVSQYLPRLGGPQAAAALGGRLSARGLAAAAVDAELARYEGACFPAEGR